MRCEQRLPCTGWRSASTFHPRETRISALLRAARRGVIMGVFPGLGRVFMIGCSRTAIPGRGFMIGDSWSIGGEGGGEFLGGAGPGGGLGPRARWDTEAGDRFEESFRITWRHGDRGVPHEFGDAADTGGDAAESGAHRLLERERTGL